MAKAKRAYRILFVPEPGTPVPARWRVEADVIVEGDQVTEDRYDGAGREMLARAGEAA